MRTPFFADATETAAAGASLRAGERSFSVAVCGRAEQLVQDSTSYRNGGGNADRRLAYIRERRAKTQTAQDGGEDVRLTRNGMPSVTVHASDCA